MKKKEIKMIVNMCEQSTKKVSLPLSDWDDSYTTDAICISDLEDILNELYESDKKTKKE